MGQGKRNYVGSKRTLVHMAYSIVCVRGEKCVLFIVCIRGEKFVPFIVRIRGEKCVLTMSEIDASRTIGKMR